MSRVRGLVIIAVLGLVTGLVPAGALADHASPANPWPVDGADSANSRSASVVGPAGPAVAWSEDYPDYAILGGIGGTAGGGGRSVVDNDGNLLLRANLRDTHPAYAGGSRHVLASISATDGSVRWEALEHATRDVHSSCIPAVAADGTVYTTVKAGDSGVAVKLVGLDPETGQQLGGGVDVGRNCTASLQFAHDGTLLYAEQGTTFGATDGVHRLRAFNVDGATITPRWDRVNRILRNDADAPYRAGARPVLAESGTTGEGHLYWVEFASDEGTRDLRLRKLNASTGAQAAEVAIPGHTVNSLHADPDGGVIVSTAAPRGSDFVGHLYRFTDEGGSFLLDWSHDITAGTDTSQLRATISANMVIAGSNLVAWYTDRDRIFGVDWRTGEYQWEFKPPGSGGFSGANGVMTSDAAGNAYYERFGGPRMGSVDTSGNLRGELSEAPFSGRVGYLGPFTSDGGMYVYSNGVSVAMLLESGAERIAGSNRWETAALLSQATFSPGVDTVYVASGLDYPDALAGGVAAAVNNAPLLLVAADSIPAATAAELTRLRPWSIVLLGGESVIDSTVEDKLADYAHLGEEGVERLSGENRFATARAIAEATFPNGATTVHASTGSNFPDAISAVPAAATAAGPILLVTRDSVPGPTGTALAGMDPDDIVVLGGKAAVSDEVVDLMLAGYGTPRRIAGGDRYETSALLAADAFPDGGTVDTVFIATGENYPDALAAGAVAGAVPAPVLLTRADALPPSIGEQLERLGPSRIVILGGTSAVNETVAAQLGEYLD